MGCLVNICCLIETEAKSERMTKLKTFIFVTQQSQQTDIHDSELFSLIQTVVKFKRMLK